MQARYWTICRKERAKPQGQSSRFTGLLTFHPVTYFHDVFVVAERTRLQAAEMMFRLRTAGLRGSVRS